MIPINKDAQEDNERAKNARLYNLVAWTIGAFIGGRLRLQKEVDRVYNKFGDGDIIGGGWTASAQRTSAKRVAAITGSTMSSVYSQLNASVFVEFIQTYQGHKFAVDTSIGVLTPSKVYTRESKAFQKAFDSVWNPLSGTPDVTRRKKAFARKVRSTIVRGWERGDSITKISKDLDIVYGLRDASGVMEWPVAPKAIKADMTGKIPVKLSKYPKKIPKTGGEIYNTVRVARTELSRMNKIGSLERMYDAQRLGIEEKLQKISVFDDRTRPQSASMDGQVSDEQGRFRYPTGTYLPQFAPPQFAINDRGSFVPYIEGISGELGERRARNVESGKSELIGKMTFAEWAETQAFKRKNGFIVNRYGQQLV